MKSPAGKLNSQKAMYLSTRSPGFLSLRGASLCEAENSWTRRSLLQEKKAGTLVFLLEVRFKDPIGLPYQSQVSRRTHILTSDSASIAFSNFHLF